MNTIDKGTAKNSGYTILLFEKRSQKDNNGSDKQVTA
jgi:hypothetical protein